VSKEYFKNSSCSDPRFCLGNTLLPYIFNLFNGAIYFAKNGFLFFLLTSTSLLWFVFVGTGTIDYCLRYLCFVKFVVLCSIQTELDLSSVRELEDLIIEGISAGKNVGNMCHPVMHRMRNTVLIPAYVFIQYRYIILYISSQYIIYIH
jgi:hypothetical protein